MPVKLTDTIPTGRAYASEVAFDSDIARVVFEESPDALVVVDCRGVVVAANHRVEALLGYRPDELVGRDVELLLPERFRPDHVGYRRHYTEQPHPRPMGLGLGLWAQRSNGVSVPVEISLSPCTVDGQPLVIAVLRDVSARLSIEAERQRTAELELLIDERERIAADLHDSVIQRLFAVGISLQALASRRDLAGVERLDDAIDQIDATIKEIRATIFSIAAPHAAPDLEREVRALCQQAERFLPSSPELSFAIDGVESVPDRLQIEIIATLREALSNVARHAQAHNVRVDVKVGKRVDIEVVDDGVGLVNASSAGSGLRNLDSRARRLGGEFQISAGAAGGTVLHWTVPLGSRDHT